MDLSRQQMHFEDKCCAVLQVQAPWDSNKAQHIPAFNTTNGLKNNL
jgi:hypothetical protein